MGIVTCENLIDIPVASTGCPASVAQFQVLSSWNLPFDISLYH